MVTIILPKNFGPWLSAAARLSLISISAILAISPVHAAQQQQPVRPQQIGQVSEKVDELIADKLVWSSITALDQANRTGNYSVLRDLGAPSFQANNSAATLGGIFEHLRGLHVDLANTLIVMPVYSSPPFIQGGILRAKGIFALRPTPIGFDLLFQQVSGEWKLLGISVVPLVRTTPPPGR